MKRLKKSEVLKEGYFKGLKTVADILQRKLNESDDGLNEEAKTVRDIDQWIYLLIEDGFDTEDEGDAEWVRTKKWPSFAGTYTSDHDNSTFQCSTQVTRLHYDRQRDILKIDTEWGVFVFPHFRSAWRESDCEDMVVRSFRNVSLWLTNDKGEREVLTFEYLTIGF